MSYAEDENNDAVVLNFANEPIVAHPLFPELPKARALQGLPDAARIIQIGQSLMKEFQDAPGMLRV